ncbi:hypothetical protein Aduo_001454 [Ancylostoma duodenale]
MMAHQITREIEGRLPQEQLALKKGVWGCTHAYILDRTINKYAERHKKKLHMLWVDMTKAYDSLFHRAIKWTLARWGISARAR